MEIALRCLVTLLTYIGIIVNALMNLIRPCIKPSYPPIRNQLLTKSVGELVRELQQKKLTSVELVQTYIARIKEVNPSLNAVIEDRFEEALREAHHADQLISKATRDQLLPLFARYPLLGIPFTVKESCGLKDMSFVVGNAHRVHEKSPQNGDVVELLRSAGCIPLLVSANPEFCMSFETNTHTSGNCLNPYDLSRTPAGSSGGEGALNGSGATTFGLGSDIAGSIRLPALFCGVFGHKPTGGLLSVKGHFPNSDIDPSFGNYLQLGPITRFARDLPILLNIMAGRNAEKLKFTEGIQTKDIKIYYSLGYSGLNALLHASISFDTKLAIMKAVTCFEKGGLATKEVKLKNFKNILELSLAFIINLQGIPSIFKHIAKDKATSKLYISEFLRALIGHSMYIKEAISMELISYLKGFIPEKNLSNLQKEAEQLKQELLQLLGTNGVLFMPSFHTSAIHLHTSLFNIAGVDLLAIFNLLGFPSTQVPMGLDSRGLPVGFQIIAAPYQDKLCLQIAAELEGAFGGWVPPLKHEIKK